MLSLQTKCQVDMKANPVLDIRSSMQKSQQNICIILFWKYTKKMGSRSLRVYIKFWQKCDHITGSTGSVGQPTKRGLLRKFITTSNITDFQSRFCIESLWYLTSYYYPQIESQANRLIRAGGRLESSSRFRKKSRYFKSFFFQPEIWLPTGKRYSLSILLLGWKYFSESLPGHYNNCLSLVENCLFFFSSANSWVRSGLTPEPLDSRVPINSSINKHFLCEITKKVRNLSEFDASAVFRKSITSSFGTLPYGHELDR